MIEKVQDYSILLINREGQIASWNIGAENLWAYAAKDAKGLNFADILNKGFDNSIVTNEILKSALENKSISLEGFRLNAKNERIYTNDNISAIIDGNGELLGYTWVSQNLTEYKNKELEINELNKSLEVKVKKRLKDLESFVYSVSHDLRAPLRAVAGFTQILSEHLSTMEHSEEIDRYIGFITDNSKRMSMLIDDLLAFSKFGNQAVKKSNFDLKDLIHGIHEIVVQQFPEYVESKMQIHGDFEHVYADENLIKQVLINFMTNAFKYSSQSENPKLNIHFMKLDNEYQICFEDNGAGFESKYVDKLFKVFQRLHDGSEFEGTGIGLAIVKQIIDNHNGRVWAEGELGVGAKFYFTIPFTQEVV